jgi:hypothetical protein
MNSDNYIEAFDLGFFNLRGAICSHFDRQSILGDFQFFGPMEPHRINYRFLADRTLGKLAKWLRLLGFDTVFENDVRPESDFNQLLKDRILLTRIVQYPHRPNAERVVFIEENDIYGQLKRVVDNLEITQGDIRLFSLCSRCNSGVAKVDKQSIWGLVPDYIWETHDQFHRCPQCERIYWAGSHTERSRKIMEQLFDEKK